MATPPNASFGAYKNMPNLLRTLPLHHTQKEIGSTELYSDFEYQLVATLDFQQAILKKGNELKVIEAIELRKIIHGEMTKTLKLYKDKPSA